MDSSLRGQLWEGHTLCWLWRVSLVAGLWSLREQKKVLFVDGSGLQGDGDMVYRSQVTTAHAWNVQNSDI